MLMSVATAKDQHCLSCATVKGCLRLLAVYTTTLGTCNVFVCFTSWNVRIVSSEEQTVTVAAPSLATSFVCTRSPLTALLTCGFFTNTPPTALSVTLADRLQNRLPRKNAKLLGIDKMDVHDFPSLAIRERKTIGLSRGAPGLLIFSRVRRRCIVCH